MSKLTLSVAPEVVERAKQYAKKRGTSISAIVEAHLKGLASREGEEPPILKSLYGILKKGSEQDYRHYLERKYR